MTEKAVESEKPVKKPARSKKTYGRNPTRCKRHCTGSTGGAGVGT